METDDFLSLEEFENPEAWKGLSRKDRSRLGELFVWRAEAERNQGSGDPEKSLSLAGRIDAKNPRIFFLQGMFWLAESSPEPKLLEKACTCFQQATQLDHPYPLAWWGWGVALTRLALVTGDSNLFVTADDKFGCCDPKQLSRKRKQLLYWNWGLNWLESARSSGEAFDWRCAVQKFEEAERLGCSDLGLLLDTGNAALGLADLVPDEELLSKALSCFAQIVERDDQFAAAWLGVGKALHMLFERTGEEELLDKSFQAFEIALFLEGEEDSEVALLYASNLLKSGEQLGRADLLDQATAQLEPLISFAEVGSEATVLALRAMTTQGVLEDRLDLLQQAEDLAREALRSQPTCKRLRCALGDVFLARGHYFGDPGPHRKALEQYARALAGDPNLVSAHLGMAQAGYALGCASGEVAFFEKATRHLRRVTELDPTHIEAWRTLALTLFKSGQLLDDGESASEGLACLKRALELQGGWEVAQDVELLLSYGSTLDYVAIDGEDERPHRQAVEVLQRAVELAPDEAMPRYHLGMAWFHLAELTADLDDYRRGIEALAEASSRDSEDELIWDEWGCALLALAQLVDDPSLPQHGDQLRRQAEERFLRAAALGHGEAYYHLAWCYCQLGEHGRAVDALRRAQARGSLPPVDQLLGDEWLASLRDQPSFTAFVATL